MDALLAFDDVTLSFDGVRALDELSFEVGSGEICGLIGPNGAGKTTAFNIISGLYEADDGHVRLQGRHLSGLRPHETANQGIARTFQNLAMFDSMTVRDTVNIGAHQHLRTGPFGALFARRSMNIRQRAHRQTVDEVLDLVTLSDAADAAVTDLPFGSLKRLELARALAATPTMLLLDEPANGLSSREAAELGELIRTIRDTRELTVVVVEHHMPLIMAIADHLVVMKAGRAIADGPTHAVRSDQRVIDAYLG